MKHKNDEVGIECKTHILWKIFPLVVWSGFGFSYLSNGDLLFSVFWLILALAFFVGNPDFVLYEEGIEVKIWWMRTFVEWDNVQSAYADDLKTRIYIKQVTPPSFIMRTFVNTGLGFGRWNKNHHLITLILEERLGKRYFGGTRKKR